MSYIDSVNEAFERPRRNVAFPDDVLQHALSLRYSDEVKGVINDAVDPQLLNNLSIEDRHLFQTRTVGNMATRLALSSFVAPDQPALVELSQPTQQDVLQELATRYNQPSRIDSVEDALRLDPQYDLLPNVSHEQIHSWMFHARTARLSLGDRIKILRSYRDTSMGSFELKDYPVKPIGPDDIIFTQAFGRDSVTDKELVGIRDMHAQLQDDDAMMQYLDTVNFLPGPSNDALADVVAAQLLLPNAPEQALQWEVLYALRSRYPDIYQRYTHYLHGLWPNGDFYPTYEVKSDSVNIQKQLGAYTVGELAQGDMAIRSHALLRRLRVIADPISADIPLDPNSTQKHVRNEKAWRKREKLARLEHIGRLRVRF